jgi:hypothetical protein
LPFDPIVAEDGRSCERYAIHTYFKTKPEDRVKSPMSGEMIGKHLLRAPQIKNTIETSIENGCIKGYLAEKWAEKKGQKKEMDELVKHAKDGDTKSIKNVGARAIRILRRLSQGTPVVRQGAGCGKCQGIDGSGRHALSRRRSRPE